MSHSLTKASFACQSEIKVVLFQFPFQVYFPNAKEAEFQYVTVPNLLLSIKPQGQILYMLRCGHPALSFQLIVLSIFRLKLTFSCMMELNKYPLDDQICTMEIASCRLIRFLYLIIIFPSFKYQIYVIKKMNIGNGNYSI